MLLGYMMILIPMERIAEAEARRVSPFLSFEQKSVRVRFILNA